MRNFFKMLAVSFLFLTTASFAEMITPPVVNNNVTVMSNINASQCPSSWSGGGETAVLENISGYGVDTGTAVGVQSCTGCAFNDNTRNCICSTCYEYLN